MKGKSEVLTRLMSEIGWARARARRQLHYPLIRRGRAWAVKRKPRARSYGYDMVLVLQRVPVFARQPCGNPVQVRYALTPTVNGSSKNKPPNGQLKHWQKFSTKATRR